MILSLVHHWPLLGQLLMGIDHWHVRPAILGTLTQSIYHSLVFAFPIFSTFHQIS